MLGAGWRTIFLVNVPLGLIALASARATCRATSSPRGGGLDLTGMTLIGAAALALIYPLIEGREVGWPPWTFVRDGRRHRAAGLFVLHERRRPA